MSTPLYRRAYARAVKDVFEALLDVDGMRSMLEAYSNMLDDYKKFTG